MAEEFAEVDFNEEQIEKRFRKIMETLSKDPRKSIYGGGVNRAEAKAIYNPLGNDKFNKDEILRPPVRHDNPAHGRPSFDFSGTRHNVSQL
jgi:hypothetical protein